MFSYHKEWGIVDVTYGVELGPADSFTAPQRAFLHGYAFKSFLVLCHHKGDEVVSAKCDKDMNHSGTVSKALEKLIHGFSAFNLKQ